MKVDAQDVSGRNEPAFAQPPDLGRQTAQLSYPPGRAGKGMLPDAYSADGRGRGREREFEVAVAVGVDQGYEQHSEPG